MARAVQYAIDVCDASIGDGVSEMMAHDPDDGPCHVHSNAEFDGKSTCDISEVPNLSGSQLLTDCSAANSENVTLEHVSDISNELHSDQQQSSRKNQMQLLNLPRVH